MKFHDIPCKMAQKEVVHKHRNDDVFIYNCRSALPAFFDAESLSKVQLEKDDLDAINYFYQKAVDITSNKELPIFHLKNLPWQLPQDQQVFAPSDETAASWLESYYSKSENGYQLCEAAIPELIQNKMLATQNAVLPQEYARFRAASALEHAGISCPKVFHCSVFNDTNHYFFYGKRHEHVPGIMMMEIARQAFYAHFYRFNQHQRSSVNLSIISFNCEFQSYAQSNYPLLICVETLSCVGDGSSRERHHLRATFTQRDQFASVIEMVGTVVPNKLFKKLRDVKPSPKEAFSLISPEQKVSILLGFDGREYIEGQIISLTSDTFTVRIPDTQAISEHQGPCKFHLITPHNGITTGDGETIQYDPAPKDGMMVIRVKDWAKGAAPKFREFVKMDCFVIEPSFQPR